VGQLATHTVMTAAPERMPIDVDLLGYPILDRLAGRKYIFLIDDSSSMQPHWNELQEVFHVLAYIVKEKSRNGFEVCFNIDPHRVKLRNTNDARKILRSTRQNRTSDLGVRLSDIVRSYQNELKKFQEAQQRRLASRWAPKPKGPPPMIIYILTDGAWQSEQDIKTPIRFLVAQLMEVGMEDKHCWIQFIQFGTDPHGTSHLRHLDKELKLLMKFVDTEPSTGNVWKMLLGANMRPPSRPPTTLTSSFEIPLPLRSPA